MSEAQVAIVDYGMGNLFSVQQACQSVGLLPAITSSAREILDADAVILPGVGAFGDAMATLSQLGLVEVLRQVAGSGKPLLGVCLGMQLLMTESHEFGRHQGLGLIEGEVVRFETPRDGSTILKVPQVGWNRIFRPAHGSWEQSCLEELRDGTFMYFVHSFYPKPVDPGVVLAVSRYGHIEFCSSLRHGNIMACQFHPERSGPQGLRIYRNVAMQISHPVKEAPRV